MKTLKIGLGIVGILAALVLVLGLIMPNDFQMERYTTIDASRNAIFAKINDIKTWEEWGPWMSDETMEVSYGDITVGEGATYSWTSQDMGNGSFKMLESVLSESLKSELIFDGNDPMNGFWKFEDVEGEGTKVTWGIMGKIPYPFNAFTIFGNNKESEKMFDEGLANIKAICEREAADKTYRGYKINVIDFPAKNYLAIRDKIKMTDITAFYSENFQKLVGAVMGGKLEMDGMPSGLLYEWNEETGIADMAAAIAYKGDSPNDQFAQVQIEAGKALVIDFYGNYPDIGEAHYGMDDYMKEHGITHPKLVIEEYVTDPGIELDTAKWLTKVFYLLEE